MLTGLPEYIDVLYGGVIFAVANGLLVYTAHLAGKRLLTGADTRIRLTASGIIGIAVVVLLMQLLSPFAMYTREAVAVAVIAIGAISHVAWGRRSDLRGDLRTIGHSASTAATSRWAVLFVLGLVAVFLVAARAAAMPPLVWDSVTYHLVFAARFVQAAGFATMNAPFAMDRYDHFPKNWEIVASWVLLPFHGDLLAGFVNITLLVFGWLASYNVARELDLTPADGALAATAVCTSPLLYSYATSENADTLVFAALMSAVLFAVRYLKDGQDANAVLLCVAAGIAFGTKYTALPLAAMLVCTVAITATIRHVRSATLPHLLVGMLVGGMTLGALGARQYVVNTMTTGNPVYPMTIGTGNTALSRGSPFTDMQIQEKGPGSRRDDLIQLLQTFNYYPDWRNVTSAGPKYLVLLPLALFALVKAPNRHARFVRLVVAFAVVGLVITYAPNDGFAALSRRFWPSVAPRFMAVYFGLFAIGGLSILARVPPRRADFVRLLIVGFIAWDLMRADTSTTAAVPLIAGVAALAIIVAASRLEIARYGLRRFAAAALIGGLLFALVPLNALRAESRWRLYATGTDVHPLPRTFVVGWQDCDRPDSPVTIALTAGWADAAENWFFYPLMGRRLQNRVTYVPLSRSGLPGTPDFIRREHGRFPEWLDGLRAQGVTMVFVQAPWPVEDGWMQEHRDTFSMRKEGPGFRLYEVHLSPDGGTGGGPS